VQAKILFDLDPVSPGAGCVCESHAQLGICQSQHQSAAKRALRRDADVELLARERLEHRCVAPPPPAIPALVDHQPAIDLTHALQGLPADRGRQHVDLGGGMATPHFSQ